MVASSTLYLACTRVAFAVHITNDLVKGTNKGGNVLLVEDEHRSETNSVLAAGTDVDSDVAHGANKAGGILSVEGNECTLVLSSEVLDVLGVLGSEALELGVQLATDAGGLLDQLLVEDLLDDSLAHDDTGWVTNPGVELTVGLVGDEHLVSEEVASSLGLLGEGNHVRRRAQVPVVVAPEGTGSTETSLDLISDEDTAVLLGDITETLEERGRSVVVTTLGLNGLNDKTSDGAVPCGHDTLDLLKASLLLSSVLLGVVLERLRGARLGVLHAGVDLLLVPVSITTLAAAVEHKGSLVGQLVGLGSGLSSEDVAETLGGDLHETIAEDIDPLVGGEVADGGLDEGVVVVANRDGGDLSVDIEVLVAVNIDDAAKC
ncbi:hypothetical protein HG531_011528 [Fusarium graminearum]|nr:hypothetical protein HG531_011528 [Fusarium graminearum]